MLIFLPLWLLRAYIACTRSCLFDLKYFRQKVRRKLELSRLCAVIEVVSLLDWSVVQLIHLSSVLDKFYERTSVCTYLVLEGEIGNFPKLFSSGRLSRPRLLEVVVLR